MNEKLKMTTKSYPYWTVIGHCAWFPRVLTVRDLVMLEVSPDNIAICSFASPVLEVLTDPDVVVAHGSFGIASTYIGGLVRIEHVSVTITPKCIKTWEEARMAVNRCTEGLCSFSHYNEVLSQNQSKDKYSK